MEESENEDVTGERSLDQEQNEDSKSSRKELFLDTKGSCFLCLKESSVVEDEDGHHNVQDELTEVSIRNICRYLNINPCSILLSSLKGDLLNEDEKREAASQRNKCDFSVTLCTTCSSLSRKLIKLINQEEMTRMLMNYNLQEFNRILKESEKERESSYRWKSFQEKMMECATPVEANLVEYLRKDAKEKSSRRMEQLKAASLPKIQFSDLNRFQSSNFKVSSILSSVVGLKTPQDAVTQSSVSISEPSNDGDDAAPENESSGVTTSCDSPKEWIKEMCANRCKKLGGHHYECPFCPRVCSEHNIRTHLIITHLHRYFADKNFPQSSNDAVFRKLCKRILYKETKKAAPTNKEIPISRQSGKQFLCPYCNMKYTYGGYQYHLIIIHYEILENSLLNSKKSAPTPATAQIIEAPSGKSSADSKADDEGPVEVEPNDSTCYTPNHWMNKMCTSHCKRLNGSRYQCPFCPFVSSEGSIRIHLVKAHMDKFFAQKNFILFSDVATFKMYCKRIISKEADKASTSSVSCPKSKRQLICPHCDKDKEYTPNGFQYHFVVKHFEIMEKKLQRFGQIGGKASKPEKILASLQLLTKKVIPATTTTQEDSPPAGNINNNENYRIKPVPTFKKENSSCYTLKNWLVEMFTNHCKKLSVNRYQCAFCKRVRPGEQSIRLHMLFVHFEKYFEKMIPTTLPEITFRKYCKRFLCEATRKARGGPKQKLGQERFSCGECGRKYTNDAGFKYHFLLNHFQILEGKLSDIQTGDGKCPSTATSLPFRPNQVKRGRGRPRKEKVAHQPDEIVQQKCSPEENGTLDNEQNEDIDDEDTNNRATSTSDSVLSETFAKCSKTVKNHKNWVVGYRCLVCQNLSKGYPKITIEHHLANVHPEVYFNHRKPVKMSQERFKFCCKNLLRDKSNYKKASSRTDKTGKSPPGILCSFCDVRCRNNYYLRYHLIFNHLNILEEKLTNQPEPEILSDKMSRTTTTTTENAVNAERKLKRRKTSPKDPLEWVPPTSYIKRTIEELGPRTIKTRPRMTLTQNTVPIQDVVKMLSKSCNDLQARTSYSQPHHEILEDITQPSNDIEYDVQKRNLSPAPEDGVEAMQNGTEMNCADDTDNNELCEASMVDPLEMIEYQSNMIIDNVACVKNEDDSQLETEEVNIMGVKMEIENNKDLSAESSFNVMEAGDESAMEEGEAGQGTFEDRRESSIVITTVISQAENILPDF